jgi:[ribosomal protein S5]-alanine N-acetyltransferase
MTPFPTLETNRLVLRELNLLDAPAIFEIHGNSDAMKYFGTDALASVREAEQLIEKFASWRLMPNPGVRWGLEEKSTKQIIGSCGLFAWNREWRKCATGYEITQHARGQGLMSEALNSVLSWGFQEMNLNRIEAQIHEDNHPSLNLAYKLGFQKEGRLRQVARWGGTFHDLGQFSLLRCDWKNPLNQS